MKQEYTRPEIKVMEIHAERAMLAGSENNAAGTIQMNGDADPTQPVESKGSGFSVWDEEY